MGLVAQAIDLALAFMEPVTSQMPIDDGAHPTAVFLQTRRVSAQTTIGKDSKSSEVALQYPFP